MNFTASTEHIGPTQRQLLRVDAGRTVSHKEIRVRVGSSTGRGFYVQVDRLLVTGMTRCQEYDLVQAAGWHRVAAAQQ